MATRLTWLLEEDQMLYKNQLGGRPKRSAVEPVIALTHQVEAAKRRNLIPSALFMDVKGAYDNISSSRLLITMQ